ncbi:muscle M-line assembly protein unc-89-like isoform X1 [Nilaparvata lugens]|uniref:muscle M-line assembly protein unc-89-like isoform X1 n=1 Tax=Nilaparvata lugens TaxID=108931 RepID=UPI00193DBC84|nr:muscle M-line assembly protein unc-89-like isoform X1 [Nilaparvata lugens]XP_039293713.1 muscle M-line assembly protein unc-89-like isoform X1 [Nilaparvata lugens]XP_039293715.1 muscle M-line assembly protein unc-89-like isoform X1 [Nilaparvata lugens]
MCDEIRLVRHDGDTPWGFRLTGGRDFGTPLLVVKVIGGSIAALAGVHVGDIVRGINYVPTNEFTHLDAQRAILESNDTLVLNLIRGDEEPEEIEKKVENLELSFVVKLNRSGRISAVEEISTPCTTPLPPTSPAPQRGSKSRSGSGDRNAAWSMSSNVTQQVTQQPEAEPAKKGKITLTVMDDGPIIMKPLSSQQQVETKSSQNMTRENMSCNKEMTDEVTLHEEMMLETSLKKTTTTITERSEEEFVNEVRGGIVQRARKENRELTEDEILEMMAGEAEVLDEDKGTIGVNFQKFIPKCEFIKDSEVFKALQEEQTKKEKTEVQQLMKDPTKRFSKFLIKPNTPKPLPKPKPEVAEPMAWQKKMENGKVEKKEASEKQTAVAEVRSPEGEKTFVHENEKSAFQSTALEKAEERHTVERREECFIKKYEQHEESFEMEESINGSTSSFSSNRACAKSSKAFSVSTNNQDFDDETEQSSSNNRKDSEDSTATSNNNCKKRSSLSSQSEGRRSKTKKVGFMGVEERANIEKQLEDIQKQLLNLQRLPLEIQNHLLAVQQSLQDIVAQRQSSPVSGIDRDEEDDDVDNEDVDKFLKETDDEFETMYKEQEGEEEENEVTIKEEEAYEEDYTESRGKTMEEDEYTENAGAEKESLIEDQEDRPQVEQSAREQPKPLPHGQEDVEICRAEGKRSFPLTPQLRPMVLPGGRKWYQPKDAFNEEFIAETIVSQSEVLVGTTIGVNFRKYIPPKFDATNSAVYRLIHELEEKSKKGVAERPEKVHDLDKYYNAPISKRHFFAATLSENQVSQFLL